MCGIAGWIDFNNDLRDKRSILDRMVKTLEKRGPDDEGVYISTNVLLGHRRLVVVDPEGGRQPMTKVVDGNEYTIVYNGELYNTEDLRDELIKAGLNFDSYSDTEVLLTSYIYWGIEVINKLNGIFAFAIYDKNKEQIFLARDHMGVKPLFYAKRGNSIIFGSELKTILAHPYVKAEVDKEGLTEVFAVGPARSLGSGIYKGVKEIAPANCMVVNKDGERIWEYWKVKARKLDETIDESIPRVRELLIDAIKRQFVGDVPVCTFLSGGLDSSIISAVAADEFKKRGKALTTYSIDYEDNDKYFKTSLFQPTSDQYWAERMAEYIGSNHKTVVLSQKDLAESLIDSTLARDLPGMADIDSSLLLFTREIRKNFVVGLSGECADEIFAGYPWFTNQDMINANTFPWSRSVSKRREILNSSLKSLDIEGFTNDQYLKTLKEVPHLDGEDNKTYRMREIFYLNLKWFMVNLLNRKDRTTMYNSLEVRVPFADHRIVDYAFNLPVETKLLDGREKGLLRKAFKGILPDEILFRKKSPYPKTHNPIYTSIVCNMMNEILNDKTSPILEIIDRNVVQDIVESKGESYKTPWYGQLMTGPQLIAYLIQVNAWLKEYNVNLIL